MAFSWTPSTGLNDTTAFPSKDTGFRARLQAFLDQVKDYMNNSLASKTQEGWIAPTLVNSFTNYGAYSAIAGYKKDNFGFAAFDRGI